MEENKTDVPDIKPIIKRKRKPMTKKNDLENEVELKQPPVKKTVARRPKEIEEQIIQPPVVETIPSGGTDKLVELERKIQDKLENSMGMLSEKFDHHMNYIKDLDRNNETNKGYITESLNNLQGSFTTYKNELMDKHKDLEKSIKQEMQETIKKSIDEFKSSIQSVITGVENRDSVYFPQPHVNGKTNTFEWPQKAHFY